MKATNIMIMKIVILAVFGCIAACQTDTTSNNNSATQSANRTVTNSIRSEVNTSSNTVQIEKVKTETDKLPAGSLATPTAAYKAGYAARQKKDVAALKRVMSKDALEFMSILAGPEKTVDDALLQMTETPQAATDESHNEKITGDTATLEYPDEQGKWKTLDLVKEKGEWKITMPKANSPGASKVNKSK